jgi:hypothetical protein
MWTISISLTCTVLQYRVNTHRYSSYLSRPSTQATGQIPLPSQSPSCALESSAPATHPGKHHTTPHHITSHCITLHHITLHHINHKPTMMSQLSSSTPCSLLSQAAPTHRTLKVPSVRFRAGTFTVRFSTQLSEPVSA